MRRERVGFERIENFLEQVNNQKRTENIQGHREGKICSELMNIKIRDEKKLQNILKKRKDEVDQRLIQVNGRGTRKHQRQRKHLS